MLELLAKYAQTHVLVTEPGFKPKDVNWGIVLNSVKGFSEIVPLGAFDAKRKRGFLNFPKCPEMDKPLMQGTISRCHFLVETAEVVALYDVDSEDKKTKEKHEFFIKMLAEAGETSKQLATIAAFMKKTEILDQIKQAMANSKVKAIDKVTFQLDGEFPVEKDYWYEWWRNFRKSLIGKSDDNSENQMRCFVTGDFITPLRTHPKIEGLAGIGGLAMGDVLIGFDKESYRSYGLEQSLNAAVSEDAASAYRAGLDDLIKNHSQRLARTRVVHWFKNNIADKEDPLPWLVESPEQAELSAQNEAKRLLKSIKTGERPDLVDNYFYALTLSGAGGRVMMRDWMEGRFEELVRNIDLWFKDLEISNLFSGKSANPPSLERIITCLLPLKKPRQDYVDWVKPVGGERLDLLHSAIKGLPIPYSVIPRVVNEHRSFMLSDRMDEILSEKSKEISIAVLISTLYARMGLIKAYHVRKYRKEGNTVMSEMLKPILNEDFHSPAYQCGGLMAVLAELQRAALGDVGAGVVQRYYAAASTTPALVLGRLTRTSQFHLNKLDAGLAYWYESKIAAIWNKLSQAPPKTLSLEEQSLFAMGYYQQLADMRTKKSDSSNKEGK